MCDGEAHALHPLVLASAAASGAHNWLRSEDETQRARYWRPGAPFLIVYRAGSSWKDSLRSMLAPKALAALPPPPGLRLSVEGPQPVVRPVAARGSVENLRTRIIELQAEVTTMTWKAELKESAVSKTARQAIEKAKVSIREMEAAIKVTKSNSTIPIGWWVKTGVIGG